MTKNRNDFDGLHYTLCRGAFAFLVHLHSYDIVCTAWMGGSKMWKYTGIKKCNEFLLSLRLFDCKNDKKYIQTLYSLSNQMEKNYKIYKIKKNNGGYRTIYEPNSLLKHVQKQILKNILNQKAISSYAKAYHQSFSLKDNAIPHQNKKQILKLDIKDFFESITFWDIYQNCFPIAYFPEPVGMLLTYLCTYDDHLTQGSPTSSYISNLVLKDFDESVGAWCKEKNISYTRYSDDMTFSGDFSIQEVIQYVRRLLHPLHLQLNEQKTHVISQSSCQRVTGIVVNEKIQVSSHYRRQIRQEIYYIQKYGLKSHLVKQGNCSNPKRYLDQLYGKILYVLQINPNDSEFITYRELANQFKRQ